MRKDGGNIGRPHPVLAPARRLLVLAAAAGVAGCAGTEVASVEEPVACPDVRIVEDVAQVTQFRDGPGRDLTDVVARAVVLDFGGQCEYRDDSVMVDLDLTLGAERGPAATGDRARFPYFVAVADPQRRILAKQVFDAEIVFPSGAGQAGTREGLRQVIPLARPAEGEFYEILVGFQATPEQLEFNRR